MSNTQSQTHTKAAAQPSFNSMQTGILQRKCACGRHTIAGGECEECQQKHEGMLQRAAVSSASVNTVPPIVHEVLNSSGQPLDADTRAFVEPRFGHDFSQVRVHIDEKAAKSARSVNALAYTVGRDVVFGTGQYAPGTNEGEHLLAHELAHVVQQGVQTASSGHSEGLTIPKDMSLEAEAHHAARFSNSNLQLSTVAHVPGTALQKFDSFEHVELGDEAGGPKSGRILLDAHKKDLPERDKQPVEKWHNPWPKLMATATKEQKDAITQGLTYGEVVALSGDFYKSFEDLNRASLKEIFDLIPLIRSNKTSTTQLEEATGGRYLALAKQNESHFSNVTQGHSNIAVWRERHIQAILKAMSGDANLAWGINAAADHFLTDAFSSGHIRTPRSQLMGSKLGDVESKILHDLDNEYGVEVKNEKGERWTAYGDDFLDDKQGRNKRNKELALEAVRLSKQDIQNALSQRNAYQRPTQDKKFESELLVPAPVDPTKDRWTGRVPTYMVGMGDQPVRMADDYTMMRDRIIAKEGPGAVKGTFTEDTQIRNWVKNQPTAAIERQSRDEKVRMVKTLLEGVVTEDDVVTIETILRTVSGAGEMQYIRSKIDPWKVLIQNMALR